jgi:hypothetical protein
MGYIAVPARQLRIFSEIGFASQGFVVDCSEGPIALIRVLAGPSFIASDTPRNRPVKSRAYKLLLVRDKIQRREKVVSVVIFDTIAFRYPCLCRIANPYCQFLSVNYFLVPILMSCPPSHFRKKKLLQFRLTRLLQEDSLD